MYETDNIALECFVAGKCTTVLRGDIVWSIIKLYKKLETHSRQIKFSAFTYYHICWKIYWEILVPVYDNQDKVNVSLQNILAT